MRNTIFLVILICIAAGLFNNVPADNKEKSVQKTKTLKLTSRYLNLPVQNNAPMQEMTVDVNHGPVRGFEIELAVDTVDFWVFMDMGRYRGKTVLLKLQKAPESSRGFDLIYQSGQIHHQDSLYREKLRPQFHFSSRRGWNNDPNGLVYYDDEYHLFYQHNPYGWNWGNMHWGHAVSPDLIHWQDSPIALYPDELGTMFSGSAVIDSQNTSGFQTGDEKVMVAAYTADGPEMQVQCIAYSNDKGRTWSKYKGNPVIGDRRDIVGSSNIRDPKVFWHDQTNQWIMVLFEGTGFSIFNSDNLTDWQYKSHVKGFWNVPNCLNCQWMGIPDRKKWVMYGASGTYMIGDFDGETFTLQSGKHQYHKSVMYAAQTYNNSPDGRRIQIGWGRVPAPDMPFNQMMTFPTQLSLRTTHQGIRLFSEPVREIEKLHVKKYQWQNLKIKGKAFQLPQPVNDELLHIKAEFEIQLARRFGIRVHGYTVKYDLKDNLLNGEFVSPVDHKIYLEILLDRNSIEIFANHGRFYLAEAYNSVDQPKHIELFSRNGVTLLKNLEIYPLKSIWNQK